MRAKKNDLMFLIGIGVVVILVLIFAPIENAGSLLPGTSVERSLDMAFRALPASFGVSRNAVGGDAVPRPRKG